jgi:hypothetical protein
MWGFLRPAIRSPYAAIVMADWPNTVEVQAQWREAVARLYELTRGDRPRERVEGCRHCVTEDQERELAALDRATGPPEVIDYYGFKALTTWGDERDFRWFMPRLFELFVNFPAGVTTADVLAGKIVMAGLDGWPRHERDAVHAAYRALWRLWVHGPRIVRRRQRRRRAIAAFRPDPYEILVGAVTVGLDGGALLEELFARAADTQAVAEDCVDLAELVGHYFLAPEPADCPCDPERVVARCFMADSTIAHLRRLADRWAGDDVGRRMRDIAEHLHREAPTAAGPRASTPHA